MKKNVTRQVHLEDFRPRSMLRAPVTPVKKAKYPAIDIHNHLGGGRGSFYWSPSWEKTSVRSILREMDKANVTMVMNLDGGWRASIDKALDRFSRPYPDRFIVFKTLNWKRHLPHADFGRRAAAELRAAVEKGAQGLKIFKRLGLMLRDSTGRLIAPDDRRLTPLWNTAAELGVPVLIHVADPPAFFMKLDRSNERWEEMNLHPDWCFNTNSFPSYEELRRSQEKLFRRHKKTTFICAHVMSSGADLGYVRRALDRFPNVYVDIAARIAELGRQPYTARKFFVEYADRILFATDLVPKAEMYRIYFRFLETEDEYFPYVNRAVPPQGRWRIYGVGLPDGVLKKIYSTNAKKLLHVPS